jgi:predicted RNA-binding protein YlxR (DUF448 family)
LPLPQEASGTPEAEDADEPERGPLRRCIVTRAQGERARMIRFVVAPDRSIVPDLGARLPGRGLWLSARADVLETARTKGAFARAARGPVSVPADLNSVLQAQLARRFSDHLGLARRAGQAVAGFAKAREWVQAGSAGLVVQANDGSAEERQRLISGSDVAVAWPLDAVALGAVFGRDHVVHAAVARGRLAEMLLDEVLRLSGISGQAMCKQAGE